MGLIKMAIGAVGSTLRDQAVEIFESGNMGADILMRPADKVSRGGSNKGTENVITDGSTFNVARNQCAILVENGRVHDLVIGTEETEGQYRFDSTSEPSLLSGGFANLKPVLNQVWERFKAGGQATNIMRLCYINLQEIRDNKIGMGRVPFRDSEFQMTVSVQGFGRYSFRIANPVAFFENVSNDPGRVFKKEELESQMKSEVMAVMQPALGRIAASGIAYDQLINYPTKIAEELNTELDAKWMQLRGIEMVSMALESVTVDEESAAKISKLQEARAMGSNPQIAGGRLVGAQANAMEAAASNTAGAFTGFMGMNMAGGSNAAQTGMEFMKQAGEQNAANQQNAGGQQNAFPAQTPNSGATWECPSCHFGGNTGNFCSQCGTKKPESEGWFCTKCGFKNITGKFCSQCGTPRQ